MRMCTLCLQLLLSSRNGGVMCVWDLLILSQTYILACEAHKIEQLCGEYGKKAARVFSTGVPIVMRKQRWLVVRYNFELTLKSGDTCRCGFQTTACGGPSDKLQLFRCSNAVFTLYLCHYLMHLPFV